MTSVVFGALECLPPSSGICRVLACVQGPAKPPPWWSEISEVEMKYWPWTEGSTTFDGAEPDVVLYLRTPSQPLQVLVVECKRGSGKAGTGERDQLARQIDNVAVPAGGELAGLVYLTADICRPDQDLNASRTAMTKSRARAETPIWWLSWCDITPVLASVSGADTAARLARDAAACLKRWGMVRFNGIGPVVTAPPYAFKTAFRYHASSAPAYTFRGAKP